MFAFWNRWIYFPGINDYDSENGWSYDGRWVIDITIDFCQSKHIVMSSYIKVMGSTSFGSS